MYAHRGHRKRWQMARIPPCLTLATRRPAVREGRTLPQAKQTCLLTTEPQHLHQCRLRVRSAWRQLQSP